MTEDEFILIDPPNIDVSKLERLIGTKVKNIELYRRAFTHKSALKRYTLNESFETLEFMGDSVLGFVITKFLFDRYEEQQEGFLTKARTKLVRGATLANVARKLGLQDWVLMDEKGMRNNWNHNDKILEDVFEALVGAIYLDIGLLHAKQFILRIFEDPDYVNMNTIMIDDNFKDQLMRWCQTNKYNLPEYVNVSDNSTNNFHVIVRVGNMNISEGFGKSKKQAEQSAAQNAIYYLNNSIG